MVLAEEKNGIVIFTVPISGSRPDKKCFRRISEVYFENERKLPKNVPKLLLQVVFEMTPLKLSCIRIHLSVAERVMLGHKGRYKNSISTGIYGGNDKLG